MKNMISGFMKLFEKTPDEVLKELYAKVPTEKVRRFKIVVFVALITAVVDYFYLMLSGYAGPDAICEGVYSYGGANNEMRSLRWFIPYLNSYIGKNMVIPCIIVLLYSLMIAVSVFLISEMTCIENTMANVLMTAAMVCFPVVTRQYAYLFMALSYSLSFLMVVFAGYLLRKRKIWSIVLGIIALIIMFGCYQAYVAAAASIVLFLFIYDMIKGRKVSQAILDAGIYAVGGVVAGAVNIWIAKQRLLVNGLDAYDRSNSFSVKECMLYLKETIGYCYQWLWSFYTENLLGRAKLYPLLILLVAAMAVYFVVSLCKEKRIVNAILLVVGIVIMPIAINLCAILFPHNGVTMIMKYQYVMLIPLAFLFANELPMKKSVSNGVRWVICLDVLALVIGYSVTAISTELCYKMAYDATETKANLILADVFDLEDYIPGKTKVILGGGIDWSDVFFANQQMFSLSQMESGPVFWNGVYGMRTCREKYFKNYLGVDLGFITNEDYFAAIDSREYAEMPLWPAKGSVKWIGDSVVVKMSENPPRY
ncbi:MAG: glucosyltransferase domain-containing protein [Acetatifactor sp.]|nr:glucosyltransferase domain-containing protein [Acetatifactor sp.]